MERGRGREGVSRPLSCTYRREIHGNKMEKKKDKAYYYTTAKDCHRERSVKEISAICSDNERRQQQQHEKQFVEREREREREINQFRHRRWGFEFLAWCRHDKRNVLYN